MRDVERCAYNHPDVLRLLITEEIGHAREDFATLATCCRVNKAWFSLAAPQIWRNYPYLSLEYHLLEVAPDRRQQYAELIQSARVTTQDFQGNSFERVFEGLVFTELEELSITLMETSRRKFALPRICAPKLRRIALDPRFESFPPVVYGVSPEEWLVIFDDIAALWPHITSIGFEDCAEMDPGTIERLLLLKLPHMIRQECSFGKVRYTGITHDGGKSRVFTLEELLAQIFSDFAQQGRWADLVACCQVNKLWFAQAFKLIWEDLTVPIPTKDGEEDTRGRNPLIHALRQPEASRVQKYAKRIRKATLHTVTKSEAKKIKKAFKDLSFFPALDLRVVLAEDAWVPKLRGLKPSYLTLDARLHPDPKDVEAVFDRLISRPKRLMSLYIVGPTSAGEHVHDSLRALSSRLDDKMGDDTLSPRPLFRSRYVIED